jgi:hypothetical protein
MHHIRRHSSYSLEYIIAYLQERARKRTRGVSVGLAAAVQLPAAPKKASMLRVVSVGLVVVGWLATKKAYLRVACIAGRGKRPRQTSHSTGLLLLHVHVKSLGLFLAERNDVTYKQHRNNLALPGRDRAQFWSSLYEV